ncbi:hypothetical protein BDF22DRAFT_674239 [Syncephalis plumigaleata]|nr:hypothetical protein BDF22DRAFT_674239 [Syncephalis plumigaleata]
MESRPLPPDWTSQYDDREQRLFFTNTLTQYRTWEDPRPAYYAQKEQQQQQGYQQDYPSYPPPQQQTTIHHNHSSGLSEETVYNSGLSEETVYVSQQQEEESHSSGIGVGGAMAIAAGAGLVGALAGGLIASHQNSKNDEKHKHKQNYTGGRY